MSLRDLALMLAVCLFWAFNAIVTKIVLSTMMVPPLAFTALRFAVVTVAVLPWVLPMPRPRWRLLAVGSLMGGGSFSLYFLGLKDASASAAAIVVQLGLPITTLLSVLMLGERIRWRRGLGIALTFGGALLVIWQPQGVALSGGLYFIVASAAASSLGTVMMKQMGGVAPLRFQAWVAISSLVPAALLSAAFETGQVETVTAGGWVFLVSLLFSALVVSVVAHTAYYGLIQRYEANLIAPLTLLTPLMTIGFGVVLLHDRLDLRMAIGATLALVGVLIIALRTNRRIAQRTGPPAGSA
jgi:drug/metabolite transporter (DMT)-like permease